MSNEHYLSKLDRNANVIDKVPASIKEEFIKNIKWVRDLVPRLQILDYDIREEAITKIHNILDNDYKNAGFGLDQIQSDKIV